MDGKLVNPSDSTRGEGFGSAPLSFGQLFDEQCGLYMAMGMSYDDYWNGEPDMPKHYRKKRETERQFRNEELWLQGMYVYEAILACAPALNAMSKKPKPLPYSQKPYPITSKDLEDTRDEQKMKQLEDGRQWMIDFAEKFNKEFYAKHKQTMKGGDGDASTGQS